MAKKKKTAARASAPKVVVVNPSKPKKAKKKNPAKKKATSGRAPVVQVVMAKPNSGHKTKKRRKNPSGGLGMKAAQIVGGAAAVIAVGYGIDQINTDPTYQAVGAVVAEGAIGVGAMYAGAELAGASALGAALQQTTDRGRLLYARMMAKKAQTPNSTTANKPAGTGAVRRQQLAQGGTVTSAADRVSGAAGL